MDEDSEAMAASDERFELLKPNTNFSVLQIAGIASKLQWPPKLLLLDILLSVLSEFKASLTLINIIKPERNEKQIKNVKTIDV